MTKKQRPDRRFPSPRTMLVTCGVIWRGKQFLIAQRQPDSRLEPLKWEFPGGKIEFTEDPPSALQREIREELDFEIDVGNIFCVSSHNYRVKKGETRHVLMLAYECAYVKGEPAALDVHAFRWIEVAELGRFDFAAADHCVVEKLQRDRRTAPEPSGAAAAGPAVLYDAAATVDQLKQEVRRFVSERDWQEYHSPKNLSMSIGIEAAELMEHFQWTTIEESRLITADPRKFEEVSQEIADIAMYVLSLCNSLGLDLSEAISRKLKINREKYPLEKYWGKYTE